MDISKILTDLYKETKRFYEISGRYFDEKRKLSGMLQQNFPGKNGKYSEEELDFMRRSPNGELIRKARNQADYELESAFRHYARAVSEASENLPGAIEAMQTELDLRDPELRNAIELAKLGGSLPEKTAREILGKLRSNQAQFEIVKDTMEKSGVNPAYIKNISPYNGEDMEIEYSNMVEKLRNRSDEGIYSNLAKVQDRILRDASGFGISLDPFVTDEAREIGENHLSSSVMGVKSDYEKSVETLNNL